MDDGEILVVPAALQKLQLIKSAQDHFASVQPCLHPFRFCAGFILKNRNPDRGINQNHDAGFVPLYDQNLP